MSKQRMTRLLLVLVVGVMMIGVPTVSQATAVTSISVALGSTVYCDTLNPLATCTNRIWNLGAGGVTIGMGPTNSLVLTQNQPGVGTGGFNFDTSDVFVAMGFTGIPVITIGTSSPTATATFNDTGRILSQTPGTIVPQGPDPGGSFHEEAVDWTSLGTQSGIQIWLGYADTAHSQTTCPDSDGDCIPANPWPGTIAPGTFLGSAVTSSTGCVRAGVTSCFDAGAIRIETVQVAVPEPSSLFLLGISLLGIFYAIQKLANKSIRH